MLFSAPAFLWGLLALAIPIAVHLFNFRRYRKVYFSNVDRLEELHTENRRHSTLRQWLVLLCRCLAIVAIVLAFARPVLPSRGSNLRSGVTVVSIYIDNSFSMENASADGSLLDEARRKAREIASAYSPADRFQLLSADLTGQQMRWLGRDELLDAIDALVPSPASPLLSQVVARQREFMAQSGAANRHAYVVGDFQTSVSDIEAIPADSLSLFTLVPLDATGTDNIYIDSIRLDAPAYFVGSSVTVEVNLRNDGRHDAEKLPLRLYIDGRERALATVDLVAGATGRVPLHFTLDRTGWIDGTVHVDDYPVTFDDDYHFCLVAGEPIRAVEVGEHRNANLARLFDADSVVAYTATTVLPQLDDYDFVVLHQPRRLPSGEAQLLAQWVTDGGSLLLVPATGSVADGGATAVGAVNELLGMLGAPRLDRWVERRTRASELDYDAALYRGVFGGRSDDMEMPTVAGHYALTADGVRQSIITLADGGDLLAAVPCGAGRLYLLTTPIDERWTDFASQALFVPTAYNMALYSRPLPPVAHTLGSHDPIALHGSYDPDAAPPELSDSNGTRLLPDLRRIGGRQMMVPHGELTHAGIYHLADEHLAFNYPRRESQLAYLTAADLAAAIEGRADLTLIRNANRHLGDEIRSRDGGRQLWRLCIVIALLALAAETVVMKVYKR